MVVINNLPEISDDGGAWQGKTGAKHPFNLGDDEIIGPKEVTASEQFFTGVGLRTVANKNFQENIGVDKFRIF